MTSRTYRGEKCNLDATGYAAFDTNLFLTGLQAPVLLYGRQSANLQP
jgi:hypothetical protein